MINYSYVYWTDWDRKLRGIRRIAMDGNETTRKDLITTDIGWPNGITLDLAQKKMYWSEAKLDRIEMANLDGSYRIVLRSGLGIHTLF